MCKLISFKLIFVCTVLFKLSDCTSSFDQRQTGDFNVQIGLKNIQLIALLKGGTEEYVDYDYAYDYSEMTIKPQNGTTTPKPLNVTNTQVQDNVTTAKPLADNTTEASVSPTNERNNVTEQSIIATEPSTNSTSLGLNFTIESDAGVLNQTANILAANDSIETTSKKTVYVEAPSTVSTDSTNDTNSAPVGSTTNCRRGFAQNNQGKCEYKVHGTSNALRRIVKLAQKIKIGRGYKET